MKTHLVFDFDVSWVCASVVEERRHLQHLEQVQGHQGPLEEVAHAPVLGVGHQGEDRAVVRRVVNVVLVETTLKYLNS